MSGYEKLIWDRISKITIVIEPLPEPFKPIVTEYRGISITQTDTNNFTFQYGGYTYAYLDYYTCTSKIDTLLYVPPVVPPVAPPTNTFIETCDSFNGSIWAIEYGAPVVSGGTWIFNKASRAKSVDLYKFGYGHYKIKFKVTGPRVNGINYFIFWINQDTGYNEFDIEMWGQDPADEIRTSNYRNSSQKTSPDQFIRTGLNFEDGQEHTMDIIYSSTLVEVWIDGYRVAAQANPAVMPMYFYPGGLNNPSTGRSFIISEIEYTPAY